MLFLPANTPGVVFHEPPAPGRTTRPHEQPLQLLPGAAATRLTGGAGEAGPGGYRKTPAVRGLRRAVSDYEIPTHTQRAHLRRAERLPAPAGGEAEARAGEVRRRLPGVPSTTCGPHIGRAGERSDLAACPRVPRFCRCSRRSFASNFTFVTSTDNERYDN